MTKTQAAPEKSPSLSMLRLTAEHLKQIKFAQLVRPPIGPHAPPTLDLVQWGIQAYSLPWLRHFGALIGGIIVLTDTSHRAAVRIIGRSSYELCAHVYYVKKHIKQHLDANNLSAAWEFLLPITTGSRYINEYHHPEESEMFPAPPHIQKAINCFKEVMPKGTEDDYSYLSEYCHPNMMAFHQHFRWTTPAVIDFVDEDVFGAFGPIAGSCLQGLMTVEELLNIGNEHEVRKAIVKLMRAIVEQSREKESY
jgi:hypothetical protein